MRSTALSDAQVISTANEFFIPLSVNVTTDGFPPEIPAMKQLEFVYNLHWRTEFGFASCVVIDPEGNIILGTSGASLEEHQDPEKLWSPKRYLLFMVESLERWKKLQRIKSLPLWQQMGAWKEFAGELAASLQKNVKSMMQTRQHLQ